MADKFYNETISDASFSDGSALSGSYTAEYDDNGNLIAIINPNLSVTSANGDLTTSFTGAQVSMATGSFELVAPTGSNSNYSSLAIDWSTETPTTLNATSGSAATTVDNSDGNALSLTNTGNVTSVADQIITTTINNAQFTDGATLSGTWTATYDPNGFLLSVDDVSFTVSGRGGTNTFTSMGTLPYADDPSASGFTSYEIHNLSVSGTGNYNALYIDWKTENPSSFYEGSPSLYTSVENAGGSPIRLISDGTSGSGSTAAITGLPSAESGTDTDVVIPFSGVTVTDSDPDTSATIVLNYKGVATDADGTLSGAGLTKTGVGTYSLAVTTPGNLTSELQALQFTPTVGQVSSGATVRTRIDLAVNDTDGSTSANTVLTETATCFLRGTRISTPSGDVPVEDLHEGDLVSVIEDGERVSRPIIWTGRGDMDAARFGFADDAFPIRIRRDAFAAGQPARDLLVTPEHCILTSSGLVPARMLVNQASILIDRSLPDYEYFHVELEAHGILLAEGLATESYLDTGNRGLFEADQGYAAILRRPAIAAPLAVARELVEPVWNILSERAASLGFERRAQVPVLTDQPDVRLLMEDGAELACCWTTGHRCMFQIPAGARAVRLISRAAVPAQVIGPFVDDRRSLGVAVEKLVLWNGWMEETAILPAAGLALDGWHAAESGYRWTNGAAALDLPVTVEATYLDVHLTGRMLYPSLAAAA